MWIKFSVKWSSTATANWNKNQFKILKKSLTEILIYIILKVISSFLKFWKILIRPFYVNYTIFI